MNTLFKIFLSMSLSGGLLILVLLLGKQFWKDKISRQWQYYIWLVVILRLLLPFGLETSLMGKTWQAVDQAVTQTASLSPTPKPLPIPQDVPASSADPGTAPVAEQNAEQSTESDAEQNTEQDVENTDSPAGDLTAALLLQDIASLFTGHIWLIWFTVMCSLLLRKVMIYRNYIRYIRTGMTPVSDIEILDRLSAIAVQIGVKRPIDLSVNPLISSPLLIGFFRPCIVLPKTEIPEKDFLYTILHELTHYRRYDMFYKWLVQITVCLHWFNPLVHLMSREITKACEFSCDEAVLAKMGYSNAQDYGQTLLDAMAAVGKCREKCDALTLSGNKKLLKERLSAIMKLKERTKTVKILTALLTLSVVLVAVSIGVYSASTADKTDPAETEKSSPSQTDASHSADSSQTAEASQAADDLPAMETLEFDGITYYLVQNEAQLRAISTGAYGLDQNYMQQADISLSAEEWVPIGTREDPFIGSFNGNGFEITGLTMTDPDAEIVGMFGVAENAHIYNITLRDLDIESAGRSASKTSVGSIAAITRGKDGSGCRIYDNFVYPKESGGHETAWRATGNRAVMKTAENDEDDASRAERYYASGSLPLFEIAFSKLDESAQKTWLEKLYANEDSIAFFSVAVSELDAGSSLPSDFAEKAYSDGEIAFFSILTDYLSETELESWLDRALTEEDWAFQSVLYDALNRGAEFDEQWEKEQFARYEAVGVTTNGKNYFYQGQPVHIFLDVVRPDRSLYTLQMNPAGTVNIKIVRNEENAITGVAYMTDAEVTELLGDLDDPADE